MEPNELEEKEAEKRSFLREHSNAFKTALNKSQEKIGLLFRLKKDTEYRLKFLTFLCLVWSFFILGWILGQFGPSLFDLQIITNTDLEEASFFYMAHNIGYLIGSLISGVLIGRIDCNLLLFFTMMLYGSALVAIPWSFLPSLMLCSQAVRGLCGGLLDTVANSELLSLFGNQVSPYMQAMHFAFAAGGIVSPLATAPFLADEYDISTNASYITGQYYQNLNVTAGENGSYVVEYTFHNQSSNTSRVFVSAISNVTGVSRLYIPYTLSGMLAVSSGVTFIVVYVKSKRRTKKPQNQTEIVRNERKLHVVTKIVILVIMCIIFLLYTAMEDTIGGYLATFCVEQMKMSKQESSYVTATFWALFAFGRLSGILIGKILRSVPLVALYSFGLMLSFLMLSFAPVINSTAVIWVSTSVTGFAMSVLFPTLFTWTEEDFLLVTGRIASLFIMTSTAGAILSPAALGYLIEEVSPMWYAYILLGESIGVIVFFIVAVILKKRLPQLQDAPNMRSELVIDLTDSVVQCKSVQSLNKTPL